MMAKANEIDYIRQVATVEGVPESAFRKYLANKPFSDPRCGEYLMDIAQIMRLLPQPPARLLDVGVGSGWTSALFADRGYDVLGVDISPDMIELAKGRKSSANFLVWDFEVGQIPGEFDIAVIYDALHHAEDESAVIRSVYSSLTRDGILITIEPGVGHSRTADSIEVMRKYGTTEKDMPYQHQRQLMFEAGFGVVDQFARISQLPIENICDTRGAVSQVRHGISLVYGAATGMTSIVVARKGGSGPRQSHDHQAAETLLHLAETHDRFVRQHVA